jgi:hypothetical protein
MIPNPFKLEKLKIRSYESEGRAGAFEEIVVMFNPSSYSLSYGNKYVQKASLGGKKDKPQPVHSEAKTLQVELVIDGTGVADFGFESVLGIGTLGVQDQVDKFLKTCLEPEGKIHQPRFLRLKWGNAFVFDCRLSSADVSYSLFDSAGNPLRAKLNATFIEDVPEDRSKKGNEPSSPDLTHVREVKMEDTLPLMAKDIYGSFDHFVWLARANDLDQFRRLKPGTRIVFPPLEK